MDRRYLELLEMASESENSASWRRCSDAECDNIPACINTDFCNDAPKDKNNGILAMAFVDMQPIKTVYQIEEAFKNGTLFPNLNKPFYGGMKR